LIGMKVGVMSCRQANKQRCGSGIACCRSKFKTTDTNPGIGHGRDEAHARRSSFFNVLRL
jgi:hypothetical protein